MRLGIGLEPLVIDQKREALKPEWTLREALTGGRGDTVQVGTENKHVMSYMKDFLFSPEQAGTPVAVLSGGERGRLLLARGLAQPSNLLVLDEPTNDLDLETLDLLQEFIADYAGTVILVSHDRDFIDRTCTSVIASDGDGVWREYAGGYSDMVAQKGSGVAARKAAAASASKDDGNAVIARTCAKASLKSFPSSRNTHSKRCRAKSPNWKAEIAKLRRILEDPEPLSRDRKKFDAATAALAERERLLAQKEEAWLELEILRENAATLAREQQRAACNDEGRADPCGGRRSLAGLQPQAAARSAPASSPTASRQYRPRRRARRTAPASCPPPLPGSRKTPSRAAILHVIGFCAFR